MKLFVENLAKKEGNIKQKKVFNNYAKAFSNFSKLYKKANERS